MGKYRDFSEKHAATLTGRTPDNCIDAGFWRNIYCAKRNLERGLEAFSSGDKIRFTALLRGGVDQSGSLEQEVYEVVEHLAGLLACYRVTRYAAGQLSIKTMEDNPQREQEDYREAIYYKGEAFREYMLRFIEHFGNMATMGDEEIFAKYTEEAAKRCSDEDMPFSPEWQKDFVDNLARALASRLGVPVKGHHTLYADLTPEQKLERLRAIRCKHEEGECVPCTSLHSWLDGKIDFSTMVSRTIADYEPRGEEEIVAAIRTMVEFTHDHLGVLDCSVEAMQRGLNHIGWQAVIQEKTTDGDIWAIGRVGESLGKEVPETAEQPQ